MDVIHAMDLVKEYTPRSSREYGRKRESARDRNRSGIAPACLDLGLTGPDTLLKVTRDVMFSVSSFLPYLSVFLPPSRHLPIKRFLITTCKHFLRSLTTFRTMAWACSGNTNAELIANMSREALIKSDLVAAVCQM